VKARGVALRRFAVAIAFIAVCAAPLPAAPEPSGPAAGATAAASPTPPSDPRQLTYPPLTIAFPKPERLMLPNGLLVYLFEDHELPLVDMAFYLKAGSIFDPPDKAGLAVLATTLMRTGGTKEMTPDAVDLAVETLPARVRLDCDTDAMSGSLSALKAKFPEALKIFAGMLRSPRFDPGRIEVEKARVIEDIRRRWDEPGSIADLNFRALVYGADSPWARLSTAASIGRISRDDLVEFHRRYLHPNNSVFAVAGDFDRAAMKKLLEESLGGWAMAKVTPPPVPKIKDSIPVGVHTVSRPLNQSSIELGHLGVNRFDPDKFPIKVLNFILGEGGFSSRLVKEVRSTRGLAYSVSGGIGQDSDRGLFEISCQTKAGSTIETIHAIRGIVDRLREQGPTEEEVRDAKEASINSFAFSVDGTVSFMQAYLYYNYYGYPPEYLQTYRDTIAKVTREQVMQAARKHLTPERLVILIVGDPNGFGAPLSTLGLGEPRPIRLD